MASSSSSTSSFCGLNASGTNNNKGNSAAAAAGQPRTRLLTPHKSPGRMRHLLPLPTSAIPASPAKCNMSSTDYLTLTASCSGTKRKLTPSREGGGSSATPGRGGGGATPMAADRFIPVRAAMDLDRAK